MTDYERKKRIVIGTAIVIFCFIVVFWVRFQINEVRRPKPEDPLVSVLSKETAQYRETGWKSAKEKMENFFKQQTATFQQLFTEISTTTTSTDQIMGPTTSPATSAATSTN